MDAMTRASWWTRVHERGSGVGRGHAGTSPAWLRRAPAPLQNCVVNGQFAAKTTPQRCVNQTQRGHPRYRLSLLALRRTAGRRRNTLDRSIRSRYANHGRRQDRRRGWIALHQPVSAHARARVARATRKVRVSGICDLPTPFLGHRLLPARVARRPDRHRPLTAFPALSSTSGTAT